MADPLFQLDQDILEALHPGENHAAWELRMLDNPIAVSENGRLVFIQPEDIPLHEELPKHSSY